MILIHARRSHRAHILIFPRKTRNRTARADLAAAGAGRRAIAVIKRHLRRQHAGPAVADAAETNDAVGTAPHARSAARAEPRETRVTRTGRRADRRLRSAATYGAQNQTVASAQSETQKRAASQCGTFAASRRLIHQHPQPEGKRIRSCKAPSGQVRPHQSPGARNASSSSAGKPAAASQSRSNSRRRAAPNAALKITNGSSQPKSGYPASAAPTASITSHSPTRGTRRPSCAAAPASQRILTGSGRTQPPTEGARPDHADQRRHKRTSKRPHRHRPLTLPKH